MTVSFYNDNSLWHLYFKNRYKTKFFKYWNNLYFTEKVRSLSSLLFDISVIFHEWPNMKLKFLTKILSLCGCGFWGKRHAIKLTTLLEEDWCGFWLVWYPLTKIPEIHSSLNDINIRTVALAGIKRIRSINVWLKTVKNV